MTKTGAAAAAPAGPAVVGAPGGQNAEDPGFRNALRAALVRNIHANQERDTRGGRVAIGKANFPPPAAAMAAEKRKRS